VPCCCRSPQHSTRNVAIPLLNTYRKHLYRCRTPNRFLHRLYFLQTTLPFVTFNVRMFYVPRRLFVRIRNAKPGEKVSETKHFRRLWTFRKPDRSQSEAVWCENATEWRENSWCPGFEIYGFRVVRSF